MATRPERAHRLALPVELHRGSLSPCRTVLHGVVVETVAEPVRVGRGVDNSGDAIRRQLGSGDENWKQEFGQVEMAKDVGPELKVIAIVRDHVDRRNHHTADPTEYVRNSWKTITGKSSLRIVEQDVQLCLLTI